MSITSASLSCATCAARSGGRAGGGAGLVAAVASRGGVHSTFGAAAVAAGRVEVNGARAKRAKLVAAGDQLRVRRGPFEYRVVVRGVSEHRGPSAQAAALFAEDAEGRRLRERLAEQLRVAPSLRYEGKGRPTKKERREIERLRGE